MFDKGFGADVRALLAALRSKDRPARAVLAAATLSPPVRKLLAAQFGEGLVTVQTSSFHRAPASGRHEVLPVGDGDKLALLRDAVAAATARGRSAIVFCCVCGGWGVRVGGARARRVLASAAAAHSSTGARIAAPHTRSHVARALVALISPRPQPSRSPCPPAGARAAGAAGCATRAECWCSCPC